MADMRAKMQIQKIEKHAGYGGSLGADVLHMVAVAAKDGYPSDGKDENNTYARFSPSATLSLTIMNPDLIDKFKPGEFYYIDFTKVE